MSTQSEINQIIAKHGNNLSAKEFLEVMKYDVDRLYVDMFWDTIENDKWIYVNNQIIEYIGYNCTDIAASKNKYINLLNRNEFVIDKDYKQLNTLEYKKNSILPRGNIETIAGNKTKHLLVSPRAFKESLMLTQTDKARRIRTYYLDLEEAYKIYLKYQSAGSQREIQTKNEEIKRIKDESQHFKQIVLNKNLLECKQYIYVATSQTNADKNIFKVGMTTSIKDRITGYQTGRCDEDKFKYVYIMQCVSAKELEQLIFSRLESFKYVDSNGSYKNELYVINYELLINILQEFEAFERNSTKIINNHLLKYYDEYLNIPTINLNTYAIRNIEQYMSDKSNTEFKCDPITPKDLTGSLLTNKSINEKIEPYGLKLISEYSGRCEDPLEFECLSEFKHKITTSYGNIIRGKRCVLCNKRGILDQIPIYVYKDQLYTLERSYETFAQLKESEPDLDHQLLKNIIRESRWLTPHAGNIYSILAPHEGKLDLEKPLTDIEKSIIAKLDLDYEAMRDRYSTNKVFYVALNVEQKFAYYAESMTKMAESNLTYTNSSKRVNRKSISNHTNKQTKYAGYTWITLKKLEYEDYTLIDSQSL